MIMSSWFVVAHSVVFIQGVSHKQFLFNVPAVIETTDSEPLQLSFVRQVRIGVWDTYTERKLSNKTFAFATTVRFIYRKGDASCFDSTNCLKLQSTCTNAVNAQQSSVNTIWLDVFPMFFLFCFRYMNDNDNEIVTHRVKNVLKWFYKILEFVLNTPVSTYWIPFRIYMGKYN